MQEKKNIDGSLRHSIGKQQFWGSNSEKSNIFNDLVKKWFIYKLRARFRFRKEILYDTNIQSPTKSPKRYYISLLATTTDRLWFTANAA